MYRFSLIYVPELIQMTFKWDSYQVISVYCYPEALVEAFLHLQVFAFVPDPMPDIVWAISIRIMMILQPILTTSNWLLVSYILSLEDRNP